jgi:putative transposase
LDERHLYAGVKYVENNPVRAGIARKADAYRWSSARAPVRKIADPVLSGDCYLEKNIKDGSESLASFEDKFLMDAIRTNTKTGRPCGENSFIVAIENLLGRGLAAQPRGRPKSRTVK